MEVPGLKPDGSVSKGKAVHDFCHPCDTEDQLVPAVGFCHDCQHKLCQKCYDGHMIPLITRKHRLLLLSSAATAQSSTDTSVAPVIKGTLTCPKHRDNVVNVYCTQHEVAVCATCAYKLHKSCETEDLTEIPDDFFQSREYSGLSDTLRNYDATLDLIHNDYGTNITNAEQSNDDALKELRKVKNKIIKHFNQIEKDLIASGKQDKKTDVNSLKGLQTECQAMKSELAQQQSDLQRHEQNNVDLYVISRHAFKLLEKLQAKIERISRRNQSISYRFQPEDFIQTITTSARRLGTIERTITPTNIPHQAPAPQPTKLQKQVPVPAPKTQVKPTPPDHSSSKVTTNMSTRLASAKITQLKAINIKAKQDKKVCDITGVALLSPGRLLVADYRNCSIKCVDTTNNTMTSYLKLSGHPWEVTILSDNQAAVTLPEIHQIQILSTAGTLSHVCSIKVNGSCHGIASTNDKLIVSYVCADRRVDIMDLQGYVLHTIQYNHHREPMFKYPHYVAVTSEAGSEVIYVSDCHTNKVTKVTMSGQVLLTYRDQYLQHPHGLTDTQDDHLLICSEHTHQVQLVSPHGEKIKPLLSPADGINYPQSICVCPVNNNIYVSSLYRESLNVYKIE